MESHLLVTLDLTSFALIKCHFFLFHLIPVTAYIYSKSTLNAHISASSYYLFSSPCQSELLPSLDVRRLSFANFSHFNLLF